MAIRPFHGETFVAFVDISGFKQLMSNEQEALSALRTFYQIGYNITTTDGVDGIFVSDCAVLFIRNNGSTIDKLRIILKAVKELNIKMLREEYMLTSSIAYGMFSYEDKIEHEGIQKNQLVGDAYLKAFIDNEIGKPRLQPGMCRLVADGLPLGFHDEYEMAIRTSAEIRFLQKKGTKHYQYYWNLTQIDQIAEFEKKYSNSTILKYNGMKNALASYL